MFTKVLLRFSLELNGDSNTMSITTIYLTKNETMVSLDADTPYKVKYILRGYQCC